MLDSYPVPNLINGVSQQAETQRRDTQCEAQINGLNDPVDGCLARPGSKQIGFIAGANFEDAYEFDILRSDEEKYRVFVMDGDIRAFNLLSGNECTIEFPDGTAYLHMSGDAAARNFKARTVEDTTFLVNGTVTPEMDGAEKSAARSYEALLFVKQLTYQETITVTLDGATYTLSTPTSVTSGAEQTVKTDTAAANLVRVLSGLSANSPYASSTAGDAALAGFTITRYGSSVHISRDTDFTLSCSDGGASQHLIPIKGEVKKISDLPGQAGPEGFVIKVRGDRSTDSDDYYLKYVDSGGSQTGLWEECVASDTVLRPKSSTMPHTLLNSGPDLFVFSAAVWEPRIAGDGVTTSPDPGFIGREIRDIFFDKQRLGLMTSAGGAWSKTKQYFTFFPDSAQVRLDTDPIDIDIVGSRPSTLEHAVQFNEQMFFFADEVQYVRAEAETLTEATVDVPPSTNFSFNPAAPPKGAGSYLYFMDTDADGRFTTVWEYFVVPQGTSKDATRTNDHCPKFIAGAGTRLMPSPTAKAIAVLTDDNGRHLYFYNQYLDGEKKLQSAWNLWEFPEGHTIIGGGFDKADLILTVQRADGVSLEKVDISSAQRDPESTYITRLDMRLDETQVGRAYMEDEDRTYIALPFEMADGEEFTIVSRQFGGYVHGMSEPPGVLAEVVSASGSEIVVEGDWEANAFFIGVVPVARRTFSTFYPKDDSGAILADRTQVYRLVVAMTGTGYTRAEVAHTNGPTRRTEFTGRILGSPANRFDEVVLDDINLNVGVNSKNTECTITLINDTFLPSAWQSAKWLFRMAQRSRRSAAPSS